MSRTGSRQWGESVGGSGGLELLRISAEMSELSFLHYPICGTANPVGETVKTRK